MKLIPKRALRSFLTFALFFASSYVGKITLQILCSFISSACFYSFMNNIINEIIEILATGTIIGIKQKVLYLLGIWMIGQIAILCSTLLQSHIYPNMEHDARIAGFDLIQKCPLHSLTKYTDSVIENNITYASDSITSFLQNLFEDILPNIVMLLFAVGNMFLISYKLALMTSIAILIYVCVLYWFCSTYSVPMTIKYGLMAGKRTTELTESMRNRSLGYIYSLQNVLMKRFFNISDTERQLFINSKLNYTIGLSLRETMFIVFQGVIFLFAMLYFIKTGEIPISAAKLLIVANFNVVSMQWVMGNVLGDMIQSFGEGSTGIKMFNHLYHAIEEHEALNKNGIQLTDGIKTIELIDVSCKHGNLIILQNVNAYIEAPNVVLLIGPSGCGKTTLVNIISGINSDFTGKVLINGIDIRTYAPDSLLNNMVYIMQGTNLVNDSIYFNVAFENPNVTYDEVKASAEQLNIVDINKNTGIAGNKLSGGERQRVSILRANMRISHGKMIISDELTSNLDRKNAMFALNTIKNNAKKNDAILIMIEHADLPEDIAKQTFKWIMKSDGTYQVIQQ